MSNLQDVQIGPDHPGFETVKKIAATIALNPYEREALYGYPFVVGKRDKQVIRAPLLMVPVDISPNARGYAIRPNEERAEFNPLPFLNDTPSDARELALTRLVEHLPTLPLQFGELQLWLDDLQREVTELKLQGHLNGSFDQVPSRPAGARDFLDVIDQAGVVLAPQSAYFLTSDLDQLAEATEDTGASCIAPLLVGADDSPQVDMTLEMEAKAKIFFPFPSNRAQRRAAIYLDDPTTRVIRIDGPPGTGKSLTIANLVAHIAAQGKSVLVTSQKDKALQVVDEKLRGLNNPLLPMTLLRRDKKPLLDKLAQVRKVRSKQEVEEEATRTDEAFERSRADYLALHSTMDAALATEATLAQVEGEFQNKSGLVRLAARPGRHLAWRRADKISPVRSDELSDSARSLRAAISQLALSSLQLATEAKTASETRAEKQNRQELSKVVGRNQSSYKNFALFDRIKQDVPRAEMLLRSLPAWIMPPDDVARLFPCSEGLFDVVIIDEASQVDLPSILPIVYRGKKILICGDVKQMQPKRFAFANDAIARAAWQKHKVKSNGPPEELYPTKQSLLELAAYRSDESVFLNEHFRSLPSIIQFSNERWYGSQMRIMTDETKKRFGTQGTPAFVLHKTNGLATPDSQVNEVEAHDLVSHLKSMLSSSDYASATFGVLCLFQEQVEFIQSLVEDEIDENLWRKHDLVVLNPDGMQGDERDVILYSLSFDAQNMTRQQLSPRLQDSTHIQGMLNVAFTRARDEVHVFHSAPIEDFGFAGGRPSALSLWLAHGRGVMERGRVARGVARAGKVDSQFEADVADALQRRGFGVAHQIRACGFWIDLVIDHQAAPGRRLAVECDGEVWHQEPDGSRKISDLEREEILERAGWTVLRIPYTAWLKRPEAQLNRVRDYFFPPDESAEADQGWSNTSSSTPMGVAGSAENQIVAALQDGIHDEREIAKYVATQLGYGRLGSRIRDAVNFAGEHLEARGLLVMEDGDWFLTAKGRQLEPEDLRGELHFRPKPRARTRRHRRYYG
jgi:very-short-patch-repair endonuclease